MLDWKIFWKKATSLPYSRKQQGWVHQVIRRQVWPKGNFIIWHTRVLQLDKNRFERHHRGHNWVNEYYMLFPISKESRHPIANFKDQPSWFEASLQRLCFLIWTSVSIQHGKSAGLPELKRPISCYTITCSVLLFCFLFCQEQPQWPDVAYN